MSCRKERTFATRWWRCATRASYDQPVRAARQCCLGASVRRGNISRDNNLLVSNNDNSDRKACHRNHSMSAQRWICYIRKVGPSQSCWGWDTFNLTNGIRTLSRMKLSILETCSHNTLVSVPTRFQAPIPFTKSSRQKSAYFQTSVKTFFSCLIHHTIRWYVCFAAIWGSSTILTAMEQVQPTRTYGTGNKKLVFCSTITWTTWRRMGNLNLQLVQTNRRWQSRRRGKGWECDGPDEPHWACTGVELELNARACRFSFLADVLKDSKGYGTRSRLALARHQGIYAYSPRQNGCDEWKEPGLSTSAVHISQTPMSCSTHGMPGKKDEADTKFNICTVSRHDLVPIIPNDG